MSKELIERLKTNMARMGFLSNEACELLSKIGNTNIQILGNMGTWVDICKDHCFDFRERYRIHPDYQPEPEVIQCEVELDTGTIRYRKNGLNWHIEMALHEIKFIAYEYEDGTKCISPRRSR